jgi:hypothetical protein
MKRRCAGCFAVIDGRPNKLYCSDKCRWRMTKTAEKTSAVPSIIRGTNGVLIAKVAQLGYLGGPEDTVLDLTYGRGGWWTRHRPDRLDVFDGDFTDTGKADDSVPVVCLDPPYISTGTKATSTIPDFYDRYGVGELSGWQAIRKLMEAGLDESTRISAPKGWLLMKCMNYTESGHKVWNVHHFATYQPRLRLVDELIHVTGGGAQPDVNLDGSPRQQKHARQVHSTLLVFSKRA